METNRTLDVHLLGSFRLTWGDQPVASFAQARLQYLLAYLLLHPHIPISRRQVAFTFWPDTPDEQSLSNLRTLLYRLRDALPDSQHLLEIDRHAITWRAGAGCALDVAEFEAALTRAAHGAQPAATIAALQAAVDAYGGELLPDCYDEWIIPQRERLRQAFHQALEQLIALQEQQRLYPPAIQNAERLLRLDPLNEAGHRHLMRLHLANGDRASALRTYHRNATLLRRELGVDPGPDSQALYQQLLIAKADAIFAGDVLAISQSSTPRPRLAGRQEEWTKLLGIWQAATAKSARLTLVTGEAGIGATRLAEELVTWIRRQGGDVAVAHCDPACSLMPYAPIAEWLRSPALRPRLAALARGRNPRLSEVARLLPELLAEHPNLPAPTPLAEDWQRQRFFEALAAPFLMTTRPLLLMVDDLHQCDRETLDWLDWLLRATPAAPLLVLGTARRDEIHDDHPLNGLRRALQERGRWHEVSLGPLSVVETAELAVGLAGRELTPCEARHLHYDSEGNPLFLVETLRAGLLTTSEPLDADPDFSGPLCLLCPRRITPPSKVQAVIEQRLAQLSPAGRSLARVAAVIGRQFTLDILQQASGLDESAFVATVDELWRCGIVREQGAEGYDFSHDKLRAAAYAEVSPPQRRLIHRRVARALEEMKAFVPAVLAHHYEEAGDDERAAIFWLQAGDEARPVGAHVEADVCYHRAGAILQARGDHAGAGQAMMKLGMAHHAAFDFSAAEAAYAEGFDLLARQQAWQAAAGMASGQLATLRLARLIPRTLDPAADDGRDAWLIDQLFAGLVREGRDMTILPDVARDWQIEDGGRTYIFHLRHDVCWGDGLPVTAGDFEFAWRRAIDPATAAPFAGLLGDIAGAEALQTGQAPGGSQLGVQALDRSTLRVTLAEPSNSFLYVLAHRIAFPVPRHLVERTGAAWTEPAHLAGNGPFLLADWRPGEALTLARNPDYHGRFAGNVGQVHVTLLADWTEQSYDLYATGQVDAMPIHRFSRSETIRLHRRHPGEFRSVPDLRVDYIAFDTRRPPFDDCRVRRALSMAVDRVHLAGALMLGYELPASGGFVPPNLQGHVAGIALPYAPACAQGLLAEAGHPDGRGFPAIELWGGQGSGTWATVGEHLTQQWQRVLGITIQCRTVPAEQLTRQSGDGDPHAFCIGWRADYPDPDNFLRLAPISRQTGWRHQGYQDLVAKAKGMHDAAERLRLCREAEVILVQEAPILPLTYNNWYMLLKPRVTSFPISAMRRWFLKDVVVDPD